MSRALSILAALMSMGPSKLFYGGRGARRAAHSAAGKKRRSRWATPHIGAKEQERAKRCYMVNVFGGPSNPYNKNPRSAPTLSQAARNYPF